MIEDTIKLRSSTRRINHLLTRLKPLASNTIAYKYTTEFLPMHLHDNKGNRIGIEFHCGPTLLIGNVDEQTGLKLIEVSLAKSKSTGETLYPVLIFEEQ